MKPFTHTVDLCRFRKPIEVGQMIACVHNPNGIAYLAKYTSKEVFEKYFAPHTHCTGIFIITKIHEPKVTFYG